MKKVIFSTAPIPEPLRVRLLESSSGTCEFREGKEIANDVAPSVEIIIAADTKWLNKVDLARVENLRLVQTLSAGIDWVDFQKLPEAIMVCGNVGAYADPISEHVFGMIVCLARNFLVHNAELKRSVFDQTKQGVFLRGKTLGIVGTGGIGRAVARLGKAYGMTTLGINSSGRSVEFFDRTDALNGLKDLLSISDIIVIAVPLTTNTLNLINETNLGLLKKECILINVGRGRVINEKALYDHLVANPSFKAGIDVWWKYPEPGGPFRQDYPFFDLPNFLGSPHDADAVPENSKLGIENAVRNIERYFKHEPLKGLAKREEYLELSRERN